MPSTVLHPGHGDSVFVVSFVVHQVIVPSKSNTTRKQASKSTTNVERSHDDLITVVRCRDDGGAHEQTGDVLVREKEAGDGSKKATAGTAETGAGDDEDGLAIQYIGWSPRRKQD